MSLLESLKRSEENRAEMVRRFGFVPHSIIRISRGSLSRKMFIYQQERKDRSASIGANSLMRFAVTDAEKEKAAERMALGVLGGRMSSSRRDKRWKEYRKRKQADAAELGRRIATSPTHQGENRMQASTMPAELVDFFIKYYAEPGQVYLDPFMGQGIRMQVAHYRKLHYYGMDASEEFFAYIDAVREKIDDGTTTLVAILGDSRHPDRIPDGIGDFSFHSPPYWNIEFYGEEPEQLGALDYPDFLKGMEDVARAWLPKHKPGAWHVVNVNDFRKGGVFYPYHADTLALYQRAGWVYHDMWIVDGIVGGLPKAFAVNFNMKRIAPKTHEYCLVFRAPVGSR
jgi:hypothetical protein